MPNSSRTPRSPAPSSSPAPSTAPTAFAEQLERIGVQAEAIHGNKSQPARQRALESFRAGETRVLVATDIAARGIDIDGITHVINYELPNVPESYVHRIGRTARAGADGIAISFCDGAERAYLKDIEKLTRRAIAVVEDHPFHVPAHPGALHAERGPRAETAGRARPGRGKPLGKGRPSRGRSAGD